MGKRGPKSSHPSGVGHTTAKGYHRIHHEGGLKMAHVVAWEAAYGPVPDGYRVHHRDGNKQNNVLSNLKLVDALTHKRLHSGCELRDGVWWKPCSVCGEFKPATREHWYFTREGWVAYGRCKPCHIAKLRRARNHSR